MVIKIGLWFWGPIEREVNRKGIQWNLMGVWRHCAFILGVVRCIQLSKFSKLNP